MDITRYGTAFPKRWHYYLNGVEVEEPLEWEDVIFDFARNKQSDGIVMMPSIPITFGGEGAEIIRRWIYGREADTRVTLRITLLEIDGSETTYFEGDLSEETFVDHADSVEIQTEESGLEDVINANAKVVYEIPTTGGGPDGTQTYTRYDRVSLEFEYEARSDMQLLFYPPGKSDFSGVYTVAIPMQVEKEGNPTLVEAAEPDALKVVRPCTLSLNVDTSALRPPKAPYSSPDNKEPVTLTSYGYGNTRVFLQVLAQDGSVRIEAEFSTIAGFTTTLRNLQPGDLVAFEMRGVQLAGNNPNEANDNAAVVIPWSGPLVVKEVRADYYRGETVDIPDISLMTAFTRLMRLASGRPDLEVTYDLGAGVLNLSQRLFTTGHAVGRDSGVIKASFEDFRKWFNMRGYGVVFEFFGGVERCRVVDKYRTGRTSPLWPTDAAALIADAGDGWSDMDMQFDEDSLFTAVELGYDKVEDYKLIPYKSDPCGKSTYVNAQQKSSDVLDLLTDWRADGFGLEDILLQAAVNGAGSVGDLDTVWIMDCDVLPAQTSPYYAYAPYRGDNGGLSMPGVDAATLVNMRIRPSRLLRDMQRRLAVPVSFLRDKAYAWASASNTVTLTDGGQPDTAALTVNETPAYLPLYAAFSSSIRTNLWATMQDVAKRYGFITFDYRGVTLKGFVWGAKYNPTEESSQRLELFLTPDSDLSGLIK